MNDSKEKEACAMCEEGVEAVAEQERKNMEDHGWYAHYVFDQEDCPYGTNYHTHGLPHSFNHVDVQICLAANPQVMHGILWNVVNQIKEGVTFEHGKKYGEIIEGKNGEQWEVLMLETEENDRKILRLIIPDKHGKFDGELVSQKEGCRDADVLHD